MKQPLDGLFSQQIDCRRSNFVFCRVFSRYSPQAFSQRYRNDLDEFKHFINFVICKISDIVPDIAAASAHGPVIIVELFNFFIRKA